MARQNKEDNGRMSEDQASYGKEQLLASELYYPQRDLLSVLLVDGESYTKAQVDQKVNEFMNGEAV